MRVVSGVEGQGHMLGKSWTLVGVYTPHVARRSFFQQLIKDLAQYKKGNLVLMGEFNGIRMKGWTNLA